MATHAIYERFTYYFGCCFPREPVKLPKDILCKIFDYLKEPKDRAQFAMVCHQFRQIFLEKARKGQIWDHRHYLVTIKAMNEINRKKKKLDCEIIKNKCKRGFCICIPYFLTPCCCASGLTLTLSSAGCCCCTTSYIAQKILLCGFPVGICLGTSTGVFHLCCLKDCEQEYASKISLLKSENEHATEFFFRLKKAKKLYLPPVVAMDENTPLISK